MKNVAQFINPIKIDNIHNSKDEIEQPPSSIEPLIKDLLLSAIQTAFDKIAKENL